MVEIKEIINKIGLFTLIPASITLPILFGFLIWVYFFEKPSGFISALFLDFLLIVLGWVFGYLILVIYFTRTQILEIKNG